MSSVFHGSLADAQALATELLALAELMPRCWNYGNAIHYGNIVLGLVALREGRVPDAVQHLHRAGKTPGSPQLDTFGPDMTLAKELIERGKREAALHYFESCRYFWAKHGGERLDEWAKAVRARSMPDFGPRLAR